MNTTPGFGFALWLAVAFAESAASTLVKCIDGGEGLKIASALGPFHF
jgi:hypothetical protein